MFISLYGRGEFKLFLSLYLFTWRLTVFLCYELHLDVSYCVSHLKWRHHCSNCWLYSHFRLKITISSVFPKFYYTNWTKSYVNWFCKAWSQNKFWYRYISGKIKIYNLKRTTIFSSGCCYCNFCIEYNFYLFENIKLYQIISEYKKFEFNNIFIFYLKSFFFGLGN